MALSTALPLRWPDAGRVPLRLLLIDDSVVARAALAAILADYPEFVVAGNVRNAIEGLAFLAREPIDIVLLDLEMPGRGGLDVLPDLLACGRGARVVIVSGSTPDGGRDAVRALTLGAADTIRKPGAGELGPRFAKRLAERLLRVGRAGETQRIYAADQSPSRAPRPDPIACVGIGASTGGPAALVALLGALPRDFAAPILVTQHLPAAFVPHLARQLALVAGREARVARDGDRLRDGELLVAPGDAHLGLAAAGSGIIVRLGREPAPSGCRPSVDPMLAALARIFGVSAVGVMLSGMGRDGAIGARALADAGGELIAQDAASSAVWGMPGAIAQAGLAAAILSPARIAARLAKRGSATGWS